MNPENNQPSPAINTDYLNQIAPKPPKKTLIPKSKPVLVGIIGVVFLILITVTGLLFGMAGGNVSDTERLAARLQATQSIVDSAKPNIKDTQLRELNSALDTYLTNTNRDLTPILAKHNIKVNSLSKSALKAESNANVLATLEEARLNAIYDRIYASEMAHQLDDTLVLMLKIEKSTSDSSMRTVLKTAIQSFQTTQKQFADFNTSD